MIRLLILSLFSFKALAFSHTPSEFKSYVTSELVRVDYELFNYFSERACFNVTVNDEVLHPYRTCLNPNQSKKMYVYVKSRPNEITTNFVCSVLDEVGSVKLSMCTEATTYYPKDHLPTQ